ncbi:hypothetical protein P3X46_007522 [Hevea brasiliensis]|uniref:Pectinesterase inhibitor domain-containing protein n=1 Tax=Hevea brasiliensis TaxID=3981 RepID=A0ABQ9MTS3_HEVBR|nr:pectinesterase inhibitor 3 [Hevea brasiliensis]KAJ9183707.1 hypothetical protein P3X46_007522 [Hevea brasiliensis]
MPPPIFFSLLTLIFLFLSLSFTPYSAAASFRRNAQKDLVRSSCLHASYPKLCIHTLSSYSGPANTPRDLAQAAVKVSLTRARRVSKYLRTLSGLKTKRERAALKDCVEQISDSVEELSSTLGELKHLRGETFGWQLSNAETWVSAALTNEDTCLDGFEGVESKVKSDVKRKMRNMARVTSNALYMINRLDESGGSHNP